MAEPVVFRASKQLRKVHKRCLLNFSTWQSHLTSYDPRNINGFGRQNLVTLSPSSADVICEWPYLEKRRERPLVRQGHRRIVAPARVTVGGRLGHGLAPLGRRCGRGKCFKTFSQQAPSEMKRKGQSYIRSIVGRERRTELGLPCFRIHCSFPS